MRSCQVLVFNYFGCVGVLLNTMLSPTSANLVSYFVNSDNTEVSTLKLLIIFIQSFCDFFVTTNGKINISTYISLTIKVYFINSVEVFSPPLEAVLSQTLQVNNDLLHETFSNEDI